MIERTLIDSSELRLGNLVMFYNNETKALTIPDMIRLYTEYDKLRYVLAGVPLTKDVLSKTFGLIEKGGVFRFKTLHFQVFPDQGVKITNCDCGSHKPIRFAHQLQNMCMGLLDEELFVKN